MKLFLDTADIDEIRTGIRWGVIDGVTTNPSLYAKVGGSYDDVLRQICKLTSGPVSAEVVADDVEGMLTEGRHFAALAPNIVVKIAMSENGLEAISRLADEGIRTNCTLLFSANQGLLAAKAGASLLSPFVGRLDDVNEDGMTVIRELADIINLHEYDAEIITASVRHPRHVTDAALAGAHIATILKVLTQMVHPADDRGIELFKADWAKATKAAPPRVGRWGAVGGRRADARRRCATRSAPLLTRPGWAAYAPRTPRAPPPRIRFRARAPIPSVLEDRPPPRR
jgi:transaldolase